MLGLQFNLSDKGLKQLQAAVSNGLTKKQKKGTNPYTTTFRKIAEDYRAWVKAKYRENSSGDKEWPKITDNTYRWRVKYHKVTHRSVLFVNNDLYKGTAKVFKWLSAGIQIEMSKDQHPNYDGTIEDLARHHASGDVKRKDGVSTVRVVMPEADKQTRRRYAKMIQTAHYSVIGKANKAV